MLAGSDKYQTLRHRAVIALILGAAFCASMVKVMQSSCDACKTASEYAPMPHASAVGAIYYTVLALAIWRFKFNKYILAALYLAAGCHLALVMELAQLHLACIPCVACASFVAVATLLAMSSSELTACAAVLAGLMGISYSSDLTAKWQKSNYEDKTKKLIGFDRLPLQRKDVLPMFVFERKDCPNCQDFNALFIPKLRSTYGKSIKVQITQAPQDISTPTIVVGGAKPIMWEYTPTWKELSTAIDTNLPAGKLSPQSVAAAGAVVH